MKGNAAVGKDERYTHSHVIARHPSTGKVKFCRTRRDQIPWRCKKIEWLTHYWRWFCYCRWW